MPRACPAPCAFGDKLSVVMRENSWPTILIKFALLCAFFAAPGGWRVLVLIGGGLALLIQDTIETNRRSNEIIEQARKRSETDGVDGKQLQRAVEPS